eukprot:TRINITY_DN5869_c0_g1_i1.p1 TRINITY_DN5869_c0_g1~~TRINITY_DN5869_c0_g1_i1.p1  ORF type:complete len:108 (+),score=6.87 TRINITY_DN5869_c0_g1_i1:117-440(+)
MCLSLQAIWKDAQLFNRRSDYFCVIRKANLYGIKLMYHHVFLYTLYAALSWNGYYKTQVAIATWMVGFLIYAGRRLTRKNEICHLCTLLPLSHFVLAIWAFVTLKYS